MVGRDTSRVKKFNKKEVLGEETKFQVMLPELHTVLRVRGSFTDDQRLMVSNLLYQKAEPACWSVIG